MKYCFDTSALLNLGERFYPEHIPVFTPIWDHLYDGIHHGTIVSVDYVKIELENKADVWRDAFFAQADEMFIISQEIESEYASVIQEIEAGTQFLHNTHRTRFMKGADPWIIALARSLGAQNDCAVVSGETKKLADYGLGAVCQELQVKHMNLIEFFEKNKIGS